MSRVILVSNRVQDARKATHAGGLAVALADTLKKRLSLWFGWSGDIAEGPAGAPAARGKTLAVPLSRVEYERYYLGYSNSVLWPVLHNRLDLAAFEAGYFDEYLSVNQRLATTLRPLLRCDDVVWIHDYHLIPLAAQLRTLGVTNPIGFFLHVPFPPWQTFMAIPEYERLAQHFSAYDLIGLQTKEDVSNFLGFMLKSVFANLLPDGRLRAFNCSIQVKSFPIGIDHEDFAKTKGDVNLAQGRGAVRIIGVDRLDYTKGLPNKFKAFGQFLESYPEYRGGVVLTQIASPTREDVSAYADIRRQLESLAGSINGRYGEIGWVPIHYIHRATPRRRLAGLFHSSRIAMVTPLRDGMNLVAKEYVAAQDPEDPGVLLLSRFAGAAEEMKRALIVNPYDITAMAEAIRQALEMKIEERRERHAALLDSVKQHSVSAWSGAFLLELERAARARNLAGPPLPPKGRGMLGLLDTPNAKRLDSDRRRVESGMPGRSEGRLS